MARECIDDDADDEHKGDSRDDMFTKLVPGTSQCYFVLRSLQEEFVPQRFHEILASTTSYHRACTKYLPVLVRIAELAHSTSHY